ncbi:hypothetical protein CICLE_v10006911mg [Citrus x clementina]|uniref:Uncharacterized protein n=2 Tax=Citrus TaxID=2706 RepID=V4S283_CITCL|nr:hypothetical protein CICLE_v10006911mg [Citrus x clementina]GAY61421.1 hypothetical protein CUMW_209830 [Citrus unshiu]
MIHISDIKLIRTDTTLDLSQKAEKDQAYLFLSITRCGTKNFNEFVNAFLLLRVDEITLFRKKVGPFGCKAQPTEKPTRNI